MMWKLGPALFLFLSLFALPSTTADGIACPANVQCEPLICNGKVVVVQGGCGFSPGDIARLVIETICGLDETSDEGPCDTPEPECELSVTLVECLFGEGSIPAPHVYTGCLGRADFHECVEQWEGFLSGLPLP